MTREAIAIITALVGLDDDDAQASQIMHDIPTDAETRDVLAAALRIIQGWIQHHGSRHDPGLLRWIRTLALISESPEWQAELDRDDPE